MNLNLSNSGMSDAVSNASVQIAVMAIDRDMLEADLVTLDPESYDYDSQVLMIADINRRIAELQAHVDQYKTVMELRERRATTIEILDRLEDL